MIYSALTGRAGKIGIGTRVATIPLIRLGEPAGEISARTVGVGERLTAAALLVLLAPLLVTSALVVAWLSRRSPLIAHRRVGWHGSDLWMLKLRSMWGCRQAESPRGFRWIERVEGPSGPELKHAGDPRVPNAFARFLRRHSIDEIPQFWHVIRGEMSLVGPRPMTAAELRDHYGADAAEILQVKPGIAGLWQVSGRNRLGYAERRRLDLALVRRRSWRLYLEILLRTIPEVWHGANSW
jgi:lipopolysaccharide/colanic/teichoic acid biosynthesis glycosyltransferase